MTRFITAALFGIAFLTITAGGLIVDHQQYDSLSAAPAFLRSHASLEASTVLVKGPAGQGSGFYIGDNKIVTATHVVIGNSYGDGALVVFNNKGDKFDAHIAWEDENSDVALLTLDTPEPFPTADLACGTPDPSVGEPVEVIGNPLDMVNIHTWGRVASDVRPRAGHESGFVADVTVAPGNSGGPVFDSVGRVAGLADALPFGIVGGGKGGAFPSSFALTVVVPRSEICKQLAAPSHPKPLARAIEK